MAKPVSKKDAVFSRASPLAGTAVPGRYGVDKGAPGVTFSIVHPVSLVQVIARKSKTRALSDALAKLRGVSVFWAGPDQYYVQSEAHGDGILAEELLLKLAGIASIIDQSHGRVVLRISGPRVRNVLAKGTPIDIHPVEFPVGKSALTQMAHVGIHLTRTGDDEFTLSVFRGFSESFWEWLLEMAAEFGYQVN